MVLEYTMTSMAQIASLREAVRYVVDAEVPGIDDAAFQEQARQAKEGCPVSKALAATEITLEARLAGG